MSFEDDIRRASAKITARHDAIVRGTTIALFNAVIRDTAVDEGRLRGDWQTTVGQPASSENGRDDPTPGGSDGGPAQAEVLANTPQGAGQETYLTNNMPYCEKIENGGYIGPTDKVTAGGFSRKSPQGMVKRNVDRFQKLIDEQARKNRV